jgi:hypothetical protein
LPSRKTLAKKHIPELAEQASSNSIELINKAKRVDASSDGWRKKQYEGSSVEQRNGPVT